MDIFSVSFVKDPVWYSFSESIKSNCKKTVAYCICISMTKRSSSYKLDAVTAERWFLQKLRLSNAV